MAVIHYQIAARGVHVIRVDTPPQGLMDGTMAAQLECRLRALAEDPGVRVIVLTGGQLDVFVRYFDLQELAATTVDPHVEWHSSIFHRITRLIETLPAMAIAAIEGHCMGGYELALASDLRIATEAECSIRLPKMLIAIMPGGGGTQVTTPAITPQAVRSCGAGRPDGYRKAANSLAGLAGPVDKLNAAILGPALCRVVRDVRLALAKAPGVQALRVQPIGAHQHIDYRPGALQ